MEDLKGSLWEVVNEAIQQHSKDATFYGNKEFKSRDIYGLTTRIASAVKTHMRQRHGIDPDYEPDDSEELEVAYAIIKFLMKMNDYEHFTVNRDVIEAANTLYLLIEDEGLDATKLSLLSEGEYEQTR